MNNVISFTTEEWAAKREKEMTESPRQEEIGRCNKLLDQCERCRNRKKSFTCGANMCKSERGYPCQACSFLKHVGSGSFEEQMHAPTYPCEYFEEVL